MLLSTSLSQQHSGTSKICHNSSVFCNLQADQPISLEMFSTFDLGRLGPYIPVQVAVDAGHEEDWEEEEEEDYTQEDDD